ncbi:MAG: formate dehydrogenase subunit delta [Halieaceae bacterium]|jgi:formate dehydrogenase subunit delta
MSSQQLHQSIKMVNQIAANLGAGADPKVAAVGVADHIRRFWTPDMRQQLLFYADETEDGLTPLVLSALELLRNEAVA